MARHFEVIGNVMGNQHVMGEDEGEVVGHTDEGYPIVVGRSRARRVPRGSSMVQVHRPEWRDAELAPGVIAPDQGLLPLPMGNFTFALATQTNTFQGQVQKPFRGERWLVDVVRTGASATGRLLALIFVGSDLAALDIGELDLQQLGNGNAFGVRLTMKPATPGVFIRAITRLSNALAGADTIFTTIQLLGRNVG